MTNERGCQLRSSQQLLLDPCICDLIFLRCWCAAWVSPCVRWCDVCCAAGWPSSQHLPTSLPCGIFHLPHVSRSLHAVISRKDGRMQKRKKLSEAHGQIEVVALLVYSWIGLEPVLRLGEQSFLSDFVNCTRTDRTTHVPRTEGTTSETSRKRLVAPLRDSSSSANFWEPYSRVTREMAEARDTRVLRNFGFISDFTEDEMILHNGIGGGSLARGMLD